MEKDRLAEKINSLFDVKLRKAVVKIPELSLRSVKENTGKKKSSPDRNITAIAVRNAVKSLKRGEDEFLQSIKKLNDNLFKTITQDKNYKILKEKSENVSSGYGTATSSYGPSPKSSYVDYEKLFSYLGRFSSRGSSYSEDKGTAALFSSSGRSLVDIDTMDSGARHVRYFMAPTTNIDQVSMVPLAGMDSAEWEKFKLWMKLDPVMYRLKTSIS